MIHEASGIPLEEAQAQFAEGIKRQSLLILDNVGIHVRYSDLPSYELLEQCRKALEGTGLLSRFWCRRLRPRLLPDCQATIEYANDQINYQMRREFIDAIMEQGRSLGLTNEDGISTP